MDAEAYSVPLSLCDRNQGFIPVRSLFVWEMETVRQRILHLHRKSNGGLGAGDDARDEEVWDKVKSLLKEAFCDVLNSPFSSLLGYLERKEGKDTAGKELGGDPTRIHGIPVTENGKRNRALELIEFREIEGIISDEEGGKDGGHHRSWRAQLLRGETPVPQNELQPPFVECEAVMKARVTWIRNTKEGEGDRGGGLVCVGVWTSHRVTDAFSSLAFVKGWSLAAGRRLRGTTLTGESTTSSSLITTTTENRLEITEQYEPQEVAPTEVMPPNPNFDKPAPAVEEEGRPRVVQWRFRFFHNDVLAYKQSIINSLLHQKREGEEQGAAAVDESLSLAEKFTKNTIICANMWQAAARASILAHSGDAENQAEVASTPELLMVPVNIRGKECSKVEKNFFGNSLAGAVFPFPGTRRDLAEADPFQVAKIVHENVRDTFAAADLSLKAFGQTVAAHLNGGGASNAFSNWVHGGQYDVRFFGDDEGNTNDGAGAAATSIGGGAAPLLGTSMQYPPFPGLCFMNPAPPQADGCGEGGAIDVPLAYSEAVLDLMAEDEKFIGKLVGKPFP